MQDLMKREAREVDVSRATTRCAIEEYKRRIADKAYIVHAIQKIATDLSHYLTK
jgi:hypothetical protein